MCNAAAAGNLAELQQALDSGADPNALVPAKTVGGKEIETTVLVDAACSGQLEAAALLLDRGAGPDKPSSLGNTPLMAAASKGHVSMVGLLLDRGADLHATTPNGSTAFHFACFNNQPSCMEVLVRAGCVMTAKTKVGRTGKQMAEEKGHADVLGRLRDLVAERLGEASREAVLLFAAIPSSFTTLKRLPKRKEGATGDRQHRPWLSVTTGSVATARQRYVAMCNAAAAGNLAELQQALDSGADPNVLVPAKKADGGDLKYETTVLVAAAAEGQLEAAALLLDHAASLDKPDSFGSTPLMAAASRGHVAMVGLLLERGVDPNFANSHGFTAFHCACGSNQPGTVGALVRAGCNMTAKDTDGHTGKQLAEHHGCTDVLERLQDLVKERLGEASREAVLFAAIPSSFTTLKRLSTRTVGAAGD